MNNESSRGDQVAAAAQDGAESARQHGEEAGEAVQDNKAYRFLVTFGLICYGLIHLLLAGICAQVATGGGGDASSQGALKQIASKPFGTVVILAMAVGLLALVLWQLIEATIGNRQFDGKKKAFKRVSSAGRAIAYGALGFSAFRLATSGSGGDSNAGAQGITGKLMSAPMGQLVVGLVGAVIVTVGISQIVKGTRRKFIEEDLDGSIPRWAQKLGTVGWSAKGVSLALVGALFVWAAVSFDPNKSGGLDDGLKALAGLPFGMVLLIVMALGFACFAVFCFVWSRNARHEKTPS